MNDRLTSLLEFLKKDPEDSFTIYAIALEYMSKEDFESAKKYFNILLEKDPDYVACYMQYARLKEKLNDIEGAKELYRKGIIIANKTGEKKSAQEMESFLDELS